MRSTNKIITIKWSPRIIRRRKRSSLNMWMELAAEVANFKSKLSRFSSRNNRCKVTTRKREAKRIRTWLQCSIWNSINNRWSREKWWSRLKTWKIKRVQANNRSPHIVRKWEIRGRKIHNRWWNNLIIRRTLLDNRSLKRKTINIPVTCEMKWNS